MSSKKDVQHSYKRKYTDFDENAGLETNDSENNDPLVRDFIKKYSNPRELEVLCHRWMLYDSTGVYVPPEQFSLDCQKSKFKKTKKPRQLIDDFRSDLRSNFGKGQVGIGEKTFGNKICSCCNFSDNMSPRRCTKNINENLPSCSGLQKVRNNITFNDFTTQEVNQIVDLVQYLNTDNALDLSNTTVKTENDSDSSTTILNSDNSFEDINYLFNMENTESALDLSTTSIKSEEIEVVNNDSTQETVNTSQDIIDVTEIQEIRPTENIEIVDLTSLSTNLRNNNRIDPDVIELLDDTFQTNVTPKVIDSIDLLDSDSDTENISTNPVKKSDVLMECPICLENLKDKKIMTTICGHIFCLKCIRSAIKSKKSCPNCRKKLNMNGIHPLYFNF